MSAVTRTKKLVRKLAPGDVVLDALGRPYYRVVFNHTSVRRGYRVIELDALSDACRHACPGNQTAAHGSDVREILVGVVEPADPGSRDTGF